MCRMNIIEEAVELSHLVQAGVRPPFRGKDGLDLGSEWLEALRMGRKIVQSMCETLELTGALSVRISAAWESYYQRRCV